MDFLREVMQLVFLLVLFCKQGDCYSVRCAGELTLDKDSIPIGSNLTVQCRSDTVQCNRPFIIQLNGQTILQKISCSSVTTQLIVSEPRLKLFCFVKQGGTLHLVCGRDIVADLIPSTPHIRKIEFAKSLLSATIHWQNSDDTALMKPSVRFRKIYGDSGWMDGNVTQLNRGKLLMQENLEPLTSYEFKLRICKASQKHYCSLWSPPISQRSPGQAPLSELDVWRFITRNEGSDTQNITVLWKVFSSEERTGDFLGYELVYKENGTTYTLNCSAAATHYTLQLPVEVTDVNVSAVTSAGNSPPAPVMLTYTGRPAPTVYLRQAAGGRIHLIWNSSNLSYSKSPEQILGFIVEWYIIPLEKQWKRIAKGQNSSFIDGIPPCIVHISLYVESTEGVSHPVSGQIHLKETSEDTGSKYEKRMENLEINSVVSPPHLVANDEVVIGICLMTAVPIILIINLMYLKCARQRVRKACMSMGPSWLFENLPKLRNSNAIKLLQDEKCASDLCWQPVDSDPPLSPVEDVSPPMAMKDSYPVPHKGNTTEERKAVQEWAVCPYKPQVSIVTQGVEVFSEEADNIDDEHSWLAFSPDFNKATDELQGIRGPLSSCLTVDGRPVSLDVVNGFLVLTQLALGEDMFSVEGDDTFECETETGDDS